MLLVGLVTISAGIGATAISPLQVLGILGHRLGVALPVDWSAQQEAVLIAIRLPRVLLAVAVGGSLAASGAVMQGLFRNPLADPGLVGVSSGAALAAATVLVLGVPGTSGPVGAALLPLFAFGGALAATVLVARLAQRDGVTDVSTMLLAGVAVNALAMAGTGLLTTLSDEAELRSLSFWMLGSLGGATWPTVLVVGPLALLPALGALSLARQLNVLLLGEGVAGTLGVDVERLKRACVALVALSVGASVAACGLIGFLGLVVPHLIRLALGPDHRFVLPGSLLLGAALLLGADLVSRLAIAPAELPVGVVTTLVGGPFFLALLVRSRGRLT